MVRVPGSPGQDWLLTHSAQSAWGRGKKGTRTGSEQGKPVPARPQRQQRTAYRKTAELTAACSQCYYQNSSENCEMGKSKQFWSVEETICLLEIWSSSQIQQQLDGATRTKDVYEAMQRELAAQGHDRELEQIINKIKKLKKEFREQKYNSKRSRDYWVKRNPFFEVLECILNSRASDLSEELEDTVIQASTEADTGKCKQMWSMLETNCFLKICSSAVVQQKLDGSTRTKEIFEDIQKEMAAQGYDRTLEQIINKFKSLKKEYKAQKNNQGQKSGKNLWTKIDFEVVDFILGDKEECQPQMSETVKTEPTEDDPMVNSSTNTGLSSKSDLVLPEAQNCLDTVKTEPTEDNTILEFAIDPALCSPDLKIACVVSGAPACRSYCSSQSRPALKNSEKWMDAEVQALLSLYATKKIQRDFEGQKKNIKIFEKISTELANIGIYHTTKQCREKIKKLKQDYKRIKDHNNQSGVEIKTSKWYDILDNILSHRPVYSGNDGDTENSTMELLEPFCMENNAPSGEDLEESVLEPEDSFDSLCTIQHPATHNSSYCPATSSNSYHPAASSSFSHPAAGSSPSHPVARSTTCRVRPGKRKRKESSDMVECLERLHESYLQHSREMHEALLNKMDTHMTAMLGLMGRMATAMEAQARKPSQQ